MAASVTFLMAKGDRAMVLESVVGLKLLLGIVIIGTKEGQGETDELILMVTEGNAGAKFRACPLACEAIVGKDRLAQKSEAVQFKLAEESDILEGQSVELIDCLKFVANPTERLKLNNCVWLSRSVR